MENRYKDRKKQSLLTMGENCKRLRKSSGLTLNQLAMKIGVTQQALSLFEQGNNDSYVLYEMYKKYCIGGDYYDRL